MKSPKTLVVKLTEKQKKDLIPIFLEYAEINRWTIYEAIINHGIQAIYRKNGWELKKED